MASAAWRWTRRIVLVLAAFVIVAVGAVLALLHTDWGRDVAREQIEARLADTFTGGARIGSLEGSVLGDLVLRDVVIDGPDGKPAITIDKLTLGVGLLPLLSKEARLTKLHAEGVDVDLRRDPDGTLQAARLLRPSEQESRWSVEIPELVISDAHVRLAGAGGAEDTNVDAVHLAGGIAKPAGAPLDARLLAMGTWRERGAPVWLDAVLTNDDEVLTVPSLIASVGDVHVTAAGVRVVKPRPPSLVRARATRATIAGVVAVDATGRAIAALAPGTTVPLDDLDVVAVLAPRGPWTHATVTGELDRTRVFADVDVDLATRRARGLVATGALPLARLTGGAVAGTGAVVAIFDGRAGEPMPIGTAMVHAAGDVAGIAGAHATLAVTSTGARVATAVLADAPGASARIGARLTTTGERLTLASSRIVARVRDPARASGGRAPVRGTLAVDLAARGTLAPAPDLAIEGRITGAGVRVQDVRMRSLAVAIDAAHLPSRPVGRAELTARDVVRGDLALRDLAVTAANRADGKIAVELRARPRAAVSLVEADAVVTPGERVSIDLVRHHVRTGATDWRGTGGQIVIGPRRIDLRDLASASADGRLSLAGHYLRRSGDLQARGEVARFALSNLDPRYRGTVDAHVDVTRTRGRFAGTVDLAAREIALAPRAPAIDATARLSARAGQLVADAEATSPQLGTIGLDLDIDAPADLLSAGAWKRLHRRDIRSAHVQLTALDVGRLAAFAGVAGSYAGRVDGDLRVSPTTTGGLVRIREVSGPVLRTLGPLSANVSVVQTAPDELRPIVVATIDDRGAAGAAAKPLARAEAEATIEMPGPLFDPAAWRRLGKDAFLGGALRVDDVVVEPPLLDRLGVTTNLRGRASVIAELAAGGRSAKLQLELRRVRGKPIDQPLALDLVAQSDGAATTATLEVASSQPTRQPLLELRARIPVAMAQLLANPRAVRTAKLDVRATLPAVPAPRLLATFGRTQLTGGTLSGTIDVGGTVAKPTLRARLAGTDLAVEPRYRRVKTIERMTVDATWDGAAAKLAIDATQPQGRVQVQAAGDPARLDAASLSVVAKDFDLAPLLAFAPGRAGGVAGRVDGKLAVQGLDPQRAKLAGELHVTRGRIPINPYVGTLYRTKLDVVVAGDQLRATLDGRLGGGEVEANAVLGMSGALPTGGTATIALRGVSPIGVFEPDITADVTAELVHRRGTWVANLVVKNGQIEIPDTRGERLDPVGMPDDMVFVSERRRVPVARRRPEVPTLIANIEIEPAYVESEEVRGYVRGKLRVEREGDALGLTGRIEADRGDLELFGRRYQLDRAVVRFDGSTDPLLDIVIAHDFPDVTTRTIVRGRLSDPELRLTSDPAIYSQGQLLGFLLGGEPSGQPAEGNPRDQAVSAGASLVANRIGGYVKKALPVDIDVLRYESATAQSGAAITVGTWISRSLFVAYRRRIEARPDENTGEGEIEYWLTRRLVVEGVVGDRGYNGVDLLWRRRY